MDKTGLSNMLYHRSETVKFADKSVSFLEKYTRMSSLGYGVEVDGDVLANVRAAS